MNEFKKFVKNENDNWEEYKDLINEDTKFMMRDEDGTEIEMKPREVINQLYQDNKTLENYINNLQSKIDKAIEILGQYKHLSSPTEEQANEQEEIVSNAYDILKEDK